MYTLPRPLGSAHILHCLQVWLCYGRCASKRDINHTSTSQRIIRGQRIFPVGSTYFLGSADSTLEFETTAKTFEQRREDANHTAWEQMRLQSLITIQPHIKDKISPTQLLPFPWDKETSIEPEMSMAERRERARKRLEMED